MSVEPKSSSAEFVESVVEKVHGFWREMVSRWRSVFSREPRLDVQRIDAPNGRHLYILFGDLFLRMGIACAISFFLVKYLVKKLDPTNDKKEASRKKAKELLHKLGVNSNINLSDHEVQIAVHLVLAHSEAISWDDVGGLDDIINGLQQNVILPLQVSSASPLLAPPKGVLLYGPPGCGKTMLARAMARAANARFVNLQVSSLTDMWYGESQKLASAVFTLAAKLEPSIIFIDEIDAFLRSRSSHDHEATAMMKSQFMMLWDGFASDPNRRVIVMGATNRPNDVDPAILRRMPAKYNVKMPNATQRASILEKILRNHHLVAENVNIDEVAAACVGCSGSDMTEVCRLAALQTVKDIVLQGDLVTEESIAEHPMTQVDLMRAVREVVTSKLTPMDPFNSDTSASNQHLQASVNISLRDLIETLNSHVPARPIVNNNDESEMD